MKFDVLNRFSGKVQFTAEIKCDQSASHSLKLGLAVKWAIQTNANLADVNLADVNLARANLANANLADANLADANLADANLAGAYLAGANLARAYLANANLADVNLAGAYLANANLANANLADVNLARANLANANLANANLADANLADANLANANLADANLARANLARAYLANANLADANLADANLARANLADAKSVKKQPIQTIILPDGDLIGWKKLNNGIIAKLLIPSSAKRVNSTDRKCRAEYVQVLELTANTQACGLYDSKTVYKVGEITRPDSFNEDWRVKCSHGIHFFITREEAEQFSM
ncbi:MAG TPA: pentapeptide repeat-containing protein [Candidatus Angelobacter sp.]|nr:pentapeptide repeat-containing protein [Candidatus Angelobacter sp.]